MAVVLTEEAGFRLANIILSQKKSFTLDELLNQINQTGIMMSNENVLRRSLNRLCDNGIIIKHGSLYSVSMNDF